MVTPHHPYNRYPSAAAQISRSAAETGAKVRHFAFGPSLLLVALFVTCGVRPLPAQQEISFLEQFALAEDRLEALRELIPGTECLASYGNGISGYLS